jgi:hypothetical protein
VGKEALCQRLLILGKDVEREPVRLSDGLGQMRIAAEGHQDQGRLEGHLHSPGHGGGVQHIRSCRSQYINAVRKKIQSFYANIGRRCIWRHDSLLSVYPP